MAEEIIQYTSATDQGGGSAQWTGPNLAVDKSNNTYAAVYNLNQYQLSSVLNGTDHDNVRTEGTITKVEFGLEGYTDYSVGTCNVRIYIGAQSSNFAITIGSSDDGSIGWVDITNATGAPSPWTWSDIDALDGGPQAINLADPVFRNWAIDQLYLRVTGEWEEAGGWSDSHKFNAITGFSKINGISNFSKINGIA